MNINPFRADIMYYIADKSFLKGQDRAGLGSSFVLKMIHRISQNSFPKIVIWFLKNTYDILHVSTELSEPP